MVMPSIPMSLIEAARNDYLAGATLREIAAKHGYSLRAWAKQSVLGGWEEARKLQQNATHVPTLARAADERVAAVNLSWRTRVERILEDLATVANRSSEMLSQSDLSGLDVRELCTLAKVLADTMSRLADLIPPEEKGKRRLRFEELRGKSIDEMIEYANRGLIAEME